MQNHNDISSQATGFDFDIDLAMLSYLDDDEFENLLLLKNLQSQLLEENQLVEQIGKENKSKKNKKNKKQNQPVYKPEGAVSYKKGMSVLDVIEQMNLQNMTGRKAKNVQKDKSSKKKLLFC